MDIAITGSSGLIGTALRESLESKGHRVVRVVRTNPGPSNEIGWDPVAGTIDAAGLEGLHGVVHLAGAGIGDEKWTPERKREILESRTVGTDLLASTLASLDRPPAVLVSGSAVGYYGDRADEVLTEESSPGNDFLADICVAWEAAVAPAEEAGIRVARIRTGIVLTPDGGALAKTLPLFKVGLGGRMGSGRQYWSWVSIDDAIGGIEFLLDHEVSGPVNLTGPEPVTNAEFTKALGSVLHRPTFVPVPTFGPRLILGRELAEALLDGSQRALPKVLQDAGYAFRHRDVRTAFAAVLGKEQELA